MTDTEIRILALNMALATQAAGWNLISEAQKIYEWIMDRN